MPKISIAIIRTILAFILPLFTVVNAAAEYSFLTFRVRDEARPDDYCVQYGLFNVTKKRCVAQEAARKLGYDNGQILNLPSDANMVNEMAKATQEVSDAEKDLGSLNKDLKGVNEKIDKLNRKLNNVSEAEKATITKELNDLIQEASDLREKQGELSKALEKAKIANQSGLQNLRDNDLRVEIARRGLVDNLEGLKHKMNKFEDNLRVAETAFNNTVLEAFVVAKLNKFAEKFCDAQKSCGAEGGMENARKMIMEAVSSKDLRTNFSASPPAASPTPSAK